MDADHQKSAFASKRGVPKCPFGELYVLHFQTDDFFKTKSCGKQDKLSMPNQGDLLVDDRWLFEVGGKNKGFKQIKGIEDSFVVSDGIDIGYGKKIPLWLFGMLY